MDNGSLIFIDNLVLYPGPIDSVYLILCFPEGTKRDGKDGIDFLKRVALKQENISIEVYHETINELTFVSGRRKKVKIKAITETLPKTHPIWK